MTLTFESDLGLLTLTTDRAESSYGVPVLVLNGEAYGSHDTLPDGRMAAAVVEEAFAEIEAAVGRFLAYRQYGHGGAR
jgi:hypothetical protein